MPFVYKKYDSISSNSARPSYTTITYKNNAIRSTTSIKMGDAGFFTNSFNSLAIRCVEILES